jgi:hypothetical protein
MAGDKVDAELQEFLNIEQQKAQFQTQVSVTFDNVMEHIVYLVNRLQPADL